MSVVLDLLRGADLESLSRRHGVTAATISEWRDAFLAGGEAHVKAREVAAEDEETRRLQNVVADLATEKDLLKEKIRHLAFAVRPAASLAGVGAENRVVADPLSSRADSPVRASLSARGRPASALSDEDTTVEIDLA
jgi:transposase-like protein